MVVSMSSFAPLLPRLADGACRLADSQTSPGVVVITPQGEDSPSLLMHRVGYIPKGGEIWISNIFIVAFFTTALVLKQSVCLSTDECIKR